MEVYIISLHISTITLEVMFIYEIVMIIDLSYYFLQVIFGTDGVNICDFIVEDDMISD
jgi:hypothetical protein